MKGKVVLLCLLQSVLLFRPQEGGGLMLSLHTNLMWWSQEIFVIFASTFFPGSSFSHLLIKQHYVTC